MSNQIHISRTSGELSELRSLDEIKRRRYERHEQQKALAAESANARGPLSLAVGEVKKKIAHRKAIPIEILEHADAILNACDRLALKSPIDAEPMAKALLGSLLRLAWARATGRDLTNPDRDKIAEKLFQQGYVSKTTMRRLNHAMRKDTDVGNLLDCCHALVVWLASEETEPFTQDRQSSREPATVNPCEDCGCSGAKLVAYFPARLCLECSQKRIDVDGEAKALST